MNKIYGKALSGILILMITLLGSLLWQGEKNPSYVVSALTSTELVPCQSTITYSYTPSGIVLYATLKQSSGEPLPNKPVTWTSSSGNYINPSTSYTNSSGQSSITYIAAVGYNNYTDYLTAAFNGDSSYGSSSCQITVNVLADGPQVTPTPSFNPTPTLFPTPSPSATPTLSPTNSPTATPTPTASSIAVVFQEGVNNYTGTSDAHIIEYFPDNNTGGNNQVEVCRYNGGVSNDDKSALIRFDVSSIPSGVTVTNAILEVYLTATRNGTANKTVNVHKVSGSWTEGTGTGIDGQVVTGVDWNSRPSNDSVVMDSKTIGSTTGTWYSFDITGAVQDWVTIGNNYGVILMEDSPSTSNGTKDFASSEYSDTSKRPKLSVTYQTITASPTPTSYTLNITSRSLTAYPISNAPVSLNPPNSIYRMPVAINYNAGTQVDIVAACPTTTPNGTDYDTFSFVRWEGDVNSTSNSVSVIMDTDKNLVACYNVYHHGAATPTPTPTMSPTPTVTP